MSMKVPIDKTNNFSPEIIAERQRFVREHSGADIQHVFSHS